VRRIVALSLLAIACSAPPEGEATESSFDELTASDPVSAAVTQSCSTTSVKGLSQQLVDEIECLKPGTLTSIANIKNASLGSAVFPYLQTPAASALGKAVAARGTTMSINSALRTLPQQYLLYEWYLQGRCGIGLAASPGNSNHESGLAVDIDDHAGWDSYLTSRGWKWLGSSDPVHFDYVAGGIDLRPLSVLAFQKLWNENHPSDAIAEDGAYGPETEKRLVKSPIGGFSKGALCKQAAPDAGTTTTKDAAPEAEADAETDAAAPPAPHGDGGVGDPLPQPSGCSMGGGSVTGGLPLALAFLALIGRKRRRLAGRHPGC
jgi:hypothetical protein